MESWNNGSPTPEFNNAAQAWNHTFYWESMSPSSTGVHCFMVRWRSANQSQSPLPRAQLWGLNTAPCCLLVPNVLYGSASVTCISLQRTRGSAL